HTPRVFDCLRRHIESRHARTHAREVACDPPLAATVLKHAFVRDIAHHLLHLLIDILCRTHGVVARVEVATSVFLIVEARLSSEPLLELVLLLRRFILHGESFLRSLGCRAARKPHMPRGANCVAEAGWGASEAYCLAKR